VKYPEFLTHFQVSIRDAEQLALLASLDVEGYIFHVGTKFCRTSYCVTEPHTVSTQSTFAHKGWCNIFCLYCTISISNFTL